MENKKKRNSISHYEKKFILTGNFKKIGGFMLQMKSLSYLIKIRYKSI